MRLRRNAGLQCHLDGREHGLFIVLKNERQDVDHLAIAARLLEEMLLQCPEGIRKLDKGGAVAKGAGFALNDSQIMPPVVDGLSGPVMRTVDDAAVLANDLTFRGDDNPLRVNTQAHRPVGEGCRNAVAVAFQMDEAGR